ncbi:MAG: hypothetical protein IH609_21500 [Dehalococcoidia bacterium]|nr:hypothetical protein [Dehalococcoidia bacterium]
MIKSDFRLVALRAGMRVEDSTGMTVGHVREVSGRSVLVGELMGRRVFWLNGERIDGVVDGAVRLRAAGR